jgi:hypothetical protein
MLPEWKKGDSQAAFRYAEGKTALAKRSLAAEVRNDPEEEREHDTYDEAGNDGKVERGVFAAVNDVAGQFSRAKGEFTAKIEESADKNQKAAEKEEGAAEFAKRVHEVILPEGGNKSAQVCQATVPYWYGYARTCRSKRSQCAESRKQHAGHGSGAC